MASILVVEDRSTDREFLAMLLRYQGHEVLEAGDGLQALDMASQHHPQLVVSDVLMPSMDGYEFVRRLRTIHGLARTPVVFYTATYHEQEARALARKCGVVDLLTKPSEPDVIINKVNEVLASGRPGRAVPHEPANFDREHARLVGSKLVEKARILEQSEQRIATLIEIGQRFATERDVATLLQQVCDAGRDVTLAQYAALNVLVDNGMKIGLIFTSGISERPDAATAVARLDSDLLQPILRNHEAVRLRNVADRAGLLGLPPTASAVHSFLGVPLASPSRVYGWLALGNKLGADEFTEADARVVATLAVQAGIAFENVRLIDELRHRTAALEQEVGVRTQIEQQLREASRARDEFLAIVSHELRTPLNAVVGWARMLASGQFSDSPEDRGRAERALQTIQRNARGLARIIDDLLDISGVIAGNASLDAHPVDIPAVVEAAVDSVQLAADAKNITLTCELDRSVGPVNGDLNRLKQVMWNLLSNAIKFTPRGGRVEVRLTSSGTHAFLAVTDTGIGFAPALREFVFERFRQADSSSTRAYGGLGLGLAIAKHFVELHGGSIRADSRGEGQGATFTVELPLLVGEAERRTSRPGEGPRAKSRSLLGGALAGVSILLVEDDSDTRELLALILELAGASVVAVGSANEAMERFSTRTFDLLVSDIAMPNQDGSDLMRWVRATEAPRGVEIPAIALTGQVRVEDRTRILAAGFQQCLGKPIDEAELVASIAALLHRHIEHQ